MVVVPTVKFAIPTVRGRETLRIQMDSADRKMVRREVSAFVRRVAKQTGGRLSVRAHSIEATSPLLTLSGPGPHWLSPGDVAGLVPGRTDLGSPDMILAFVKVGGIKGPAIPVSHLGAAYAGTDGIGEAAFAGITFRTGWLDGTGTVALHEWLHGLRFTLTGTLGFPPASFPDPDRGREGPDCCPDAPSGDGPYADHLLARHLTPAMIRALKALTDRPVP